MTSCAWRYERDPAIPKDLGILRLVLPSGSSLATIERLELSRFRWALHTGVCEETRRFDDALFFVLDRLKTIPGTWPTPPALHTCKACGDLQFDWHQDGSQKWGACTRATCCWSV